MKFNLKKICLLFVFSFVKLTSFAFLDESQNSISYDEDAYKRLVAFCKGEGLDNNIFEDKNFKGVQLDRLTLKNIILKNNEFNNSFLIYFILKNKSKILKSNFQGAKFISTFFRYSGIKESKFINITIFRAIFDNFLIFDSDFSNSKFLNCRFLDMRIDTPFGKKCFISNNKFNSTYFKLCTFKNVAFRDNEFIEARFENTSFKKCFIFGADFSRTQLKDVIFDKCVFVNCKSFKKIIFTNNVVFNFCEFIENGNKNSKKFIKKIRGLGAKVSQKRGKWEEFKKFAGVGVEIELSEYAHSIISDCNKLCSLYLNKNTQNSNMTPDKCLNN
ncbi:hypothetical protein GF385_03585 [Candidatus Dependentiae bacterium]|nr:hypothetical protein [Candidatus Dependentiae bacterium]